MSTALGTFARNSINTATTNGLQDNNHVLLTNTNATCYASLTNYYTGASILGQTQMTYISAGIWSLDIAATNFVAGTTILLTVNVYSQAGNGGPVLYTTDILLTDAG